MPTTRSRGLSTADLDSLRTAVEAGRKPKVQFTSAAGQVAGQIGQIVRFDDPAADEWVVVRFGRDELPFAPGDLQLPPPKPPRPKATASSSPTAMTPAAMSPSVAAATVTNVATRSVTAAAAVAKPATAANVAATPPPAQSGSALVQSGSAPTQSGSALVQSGSAPARPSPAGATPAGTSAAAKGRPVRKPAGAKRAPELTVTLSHHDGQWAVQAARGARTLIKPTSVRAADALRMVGLLDSPAVADAVEEIVAAARAEAEDQATRLRRELAEVEAALADLSDEV